MITGSGAFILFLIALSCGILSLFFYSRSFRTYIPDDCNDAQIERDSLRGCKRVVDSSLIRAILQEFDEAALFSPQKKDYFPVHFVFTDRFVHDMFNGKSYQLKNSPRFEVKEKALSYQKEKVPNLVGSVIIGNLLGHDIGLLHALTRKPEYKTKYLSTDLFAVVFESSISNDPCPARWNGILHLSDDLFSHLPFDLVDAYKDDTLYSIHSLSLTPSDRCTAYSLSNWLNKDLLHCDENENNDLKSRTNSDRSLAGVLSFLCILLLCLCYAM